MVPNSDDIIKVATGSAIEMNSLAEVLLQSGIHGRVVGDDLTAGLGTLMPDSVELWVLSADAVRAATIITADRNHESKHRKNPPPKFPHPESDPKPDRSQGPHRMPEPHRPSP